MSCILLLLRHLRSIAAHRDHFVQHLPVCPSMSVTFLVVTHSYDSQATHAFLRMLPLCFIILIKPLTRKACNSRAFGDCGTLGYQVSWFFSTYNIDSNVANRFVQIGVALFAKHFSSQHLAVFCVLTVKGWYIFIKFSDIYLPIY